MLSRYLVQAAPQRVDYLSRVGNWPMYLNDSIGDCTCAGAGHVIEAESTYGQGSTVAVGDHDVLTAYEAVSGYNPTTGQNDNGARMQDVLSYWRKTGIAGHRILAFAQVDASNVSLLGTALATFGALYVGINFPGSAMTQFNQGKPWDVVPGATIEGGHAIHVGSYDPAGAVGWQLVTWGAVQGMTQAFWDRYVEEAWIVITPEWLNANGTSPGGLDLYGLGQDLSALTGEPNPFPPPVTPVPPPVSPPVPPPGNPADDALARAAQDWLAREPAYYKEIQASIRQWLASKNYSVPQADGEK
jgi:hypothetical protein